MNLKESPVLPSMRSKVGYIIYKYNLKYLILPVIYLLIIMVVVPKSIIVNKVTYTEYNSYAEIKVSKNNKITEILKKYNLGKEEFKVLCGIVLAEADNTYEDAYAVINTIYNRAHSKNWVRSVNKEYGGNLGTNLYYQAIKPGQFTVYKSGSYKKHMNDTNSVGYDAIIDFLYTENVMHNYLSFRSNSIKVKNSVSFSKKGNNYFNPLLDSNRI